jgi:phage terminase small subunit
VLTDKRKAFVDEYLKDSNATQAAVRAGYSAKSASIIGCRLLKEPQVSAALASARDKVSRRNELSVDEIVAELRRIAFGAAETESNQLKALELLGRYKAMFTEKTEHSGELSLPVRVVHEYQPLQLEPAIEVQALSPVSGEEVGEGARKP